MNTVNENKADEIRELCGNYAVENFKNGLNCCESVYNALLRAGVLKNVAPETQAMCIGFGGGIGLSGHTCGALSAIIMACGAVYGRPDPWAVPAEERMAEIAGKYYRRYNRVVHEFESKFGSTDCAGISAPYEDWHSVERRKNCLKLIANSAKLAYDILQVPQEEAFQLPYGENMGGNT
ncbi:C-GCAxxG-C-C family protein [Flavonifractor sp. HCP28S3_F3]|uniref:C-GCAxxG-C-C family protein n=1 Tax=Flavonifractor sp. HCP28S3_F3 TaxID=3438939 RepID=UPI003F8C6082